MKSNYKEEINKFLVKEVENKYQIKLTDRLFQFVVNVFRFLNTIPKDKKYDVFHYQLAKSSSSMGANYEEAQGAFSKKDFASKIG